MNEIGQSYDAYDDEDDPLVVPPPVVSEFGQNLT